MKKFLLVFIFSLLCYGEDKLIDVYIAKLTYKDHYNINDKKLNNTYEIIRQDRANFHKYLKFDKEDTPDTYFYSYSNRNNIKNMIKNSNIPKSLLNKIKKTNDLIVEVKIYNNKLEIEEVNLSEYRKEKGVYKIVNIKNTKTVKIYKKPSNKSLSIGELPYNFFGLSIDFCVFDNSEKWCKILNNFGWINKKYIEKSSEEPKMSPKYFNFNNNYTTINIYKGPSEKYHILSTIQNHNNINFIFFSSVKIKNSIWYFGIVFNKKPVVGWIPNYYIKNRKLEKKN